MRLNSYNMAVKVLNAKGCFADMVDRMWGYMEEGDTENAQCVREKAIGLYALLETAGRWKPTITDGERYSVVFETGAITSPVIAHRFTYNGVSIMSSGILFGDDQSVINQFTKLFNCHIGDDDLIDFKMVRPSTESVYGVLTVSDSLLPLVSSELSFFGFAGGQADLSSPDVFEDAQPHCLTDAQMLSIIGKIDELCECNC